MTMHDKFIKARDEALMIENALSEDYGNIRFYITKDGMKIETRSPSGSGDIVQTLYLTKQQAFLIHAYVAKMFFEQLQEIK